MNSLTFATEYALGLIYGGMEVISLESWMVLRMVDTGLHRRFVTSAAPAFIAYVHARFAAELAAVVDGIAWTVDRVPTPPPHGNVLSMCACTGFLLQLCIIGRPTTSADVSMVPFATVTVPQPSSVEYVPERIRVDTSRLRLLMSGIWNGECQIDQYYAELPHALTTRDRSMLRMGVDLCYGDDMRPYIEERYTWSVLQTRHCTRPCLLYMPTSSVRVRALPVGEWRPFFCPGGHSRCTSRWGQKEHPVHLPRGDVIITCSR